jgi:microcompartment protein CcmK/EutM
VSADEIGDNWRCDLLATIPESDGVVTSLPLTLGSLSESVAIKYNDLAEDIAELLKSRPNTQSSDLWLSQPPDPFISPNSVSLSQDQQKSVSVLSEDVTDGTVEAPTATDVATNQISIIDSVGSENSDTEGNITLSRRGVLAAITATIGGITAGILNQRGTIDIESFGYGGTPISSNQSVAEKKVNKTTDITSPPTEDTTRTTNGAGTNSTYSTGNDSSDSSHSDEIVQEENGGNDSNETEEKKENEENNKKSQEGSEEQDSFSISETQINSPITEGDPLVIQSTITNNGRESTEQTVTAEILGVGSDSKTVSLSGGSSTTEQFRIPTEIGYVGSYEVIIASEDDSVSTSVVIEKRQIPASFDVSVASSNSPVTEGDTLTISASIINTGDKSGEETVTAEIPGIGSDSKVLRLGGRSSTKETFRIATDSGHAGSYEASVTGKTDSDYINVTVGKEQESAVFTVSVNSTNSPVTEDDSLRINATVTNTGDKSGRQTVTAEIPEVGSDSKAVKLSGESSTSETFAIATEDGDAGSYEASVISEENSVLTNVTIENKQEPATLSISVASTNSPVREGDSLNLSTTVTNTGERSAKQTVTAEIPGVGSDSKTFGLSGDSSVTKVFSIPTESGHAGSYEATVTSTDDTSSTTVVITEKQEPSFFTTSITSTNSPVTEGDILNISATVTNTGDKSGRQTVTAKIPGVGFDSKSIGLSGDSSTTQTFSIQTEDSYAGTYQASVSSEDDSISTTVVVKDKQNPASYTVAVASTNSPITEGDALRIDAIVTNTGDKSGKQTVTAKIPRVGSDSKTLSLNGNSSSTESFRIATDSGHSGKYEASVTSSADSDSITVYIEEHDRVIGSVGYGHGGYGGNTHTSSRDQSNSILSRLFNS